MEGLGNNWLLQNEVFLDYGETKPDYALYNLGHFPGMVEGGDLSVKGEIYEVDSRTLGWLDQLEGIEAGLYKRAEITLTNGARVLTYIFPREQLRSTDLPIKSGDWRKK